MNIKLIETSSCESVYEVDNHKLRLYIITGGTPAIEFADDYSFCERYPAIEKWSDKHYHGKYDSRMLYSYYDHQDRNKPQGPTFEEVLPNGLKDLEAYLQKYVPLHKCRNERYKGLPISGVIRSKRVHDKQEHTFVTCELDLSRKHYIPPVTFNSGCYCGRFDEKIILFNEWWKKTSKIFNHLFDTNRTWESLSETEYKEVCNHLNEWKI